MSQTRMEGNHDLHVRPQVIVPTPADPSIPELARSLAQHATAWQDQPDADTTGHAIVVSAVDLIPAVRCAGLTLARGGEHSGLRAPSDPRVADLDAVQARLDDGPGLTALRRGQVVRVDDVAADHRWLPLARAAARHHLASLVSLPLSTRRATLGALTLYAEHPQAFTPTHVLAAQYLAQHAAVVLTNALTIEQLKAAITSRDVIGQAKGIVMHRDGCTADQAFQLLAKTSQTANVKLIDVARWLVEHHEHPASAETTRPLRT